MPNSEVENKLGNLTAWVTAGLCFIVVFAISSMAILTYSAYVSGRTASDLKAVAIQTHNSFCAFKLDIQHRHEDGVRYLKDHPTGVTAHGEVIITAAQIKQSLDFQESTLGSLQGLDCE